MGNLLIIKNSDFSQNAVAHVDIIEDRVQVSAVSVPTIGGTITGTGYYNVGDIVVLTAIPATNYEFDSWSDGDTNPTKTVMVGENPISLTATFVNTGWLLGIAPDTPIDSWSFYTNLYDFILKERSSANLQNTQLTKFILRMSNSSNEEYSIGHEFSGSLIFGYIDPNVIDGKVKNDIITDYLNSRTILKTVTNVYNNTEYIFDEPIILPLGKLLFFTGDILTKSLQIGKINNTDDIFTVHNNSGTVFGTNSTVCWLDFK